MSWCAATCAGAIIAWSEPASAVAELNVQGASRLSATAATTGNMVELRGMLADELGRPIGGAALVVESEHENGYRKVGEVLSCATEEAPPLAAPPVTGKDGTYCLQVAKALGAAGSEAPPTSFRVSFRGSSHHTASFAVSDRNPTEQIVRFNWGPTPRVVWLEDPAVVVIGTELEARPTGAEIPPQDLVPGILQLELEGAENKRELWSGRVEPGKPVSVPVQASQWGDVGEAHLVATLIRGSTTTRDVFAIYRKARVNLEAHAEESQLTEGGSLVIHVQARARGTSPPLGIIVLRRPDAPPVYAALVDGKVELESSISRGTPPGELDVDVEYVPQDGRWIGAGPKSLRLVILGPVDTSRYLWGALGLFVVAWLKWRSGSWGAPLAAARPTIRAVLSTLRRRKPADRQGRTVDAPQGTVLDAHEGTGVAGATIRQELPGFHPIQVLGNTLSDEAGKFHIPVPNHGAFQDSRLVVEAPGYVSRPILLGKSVGKILVPLESVRRYSLRELLEWASQAGPAYSGHPHPTPRWIRDQACRSGREDIACWAQRVEEVAFSPLTPASPPVHHATRQLPPPPASFPAFPTKDRS